MLFEEIFTTDYLRCVISDRGKYHSLRYTIRNIRRPVIECAAPGSLTGGKENMNGGGREGESYKL